MYQIVQAHEGKVWARSEVGKGTSFVVRLRRLEQAAASETTSASETVRAALAAGGASRG